MQRDLARVQIEYLNVVEQIENLREASEHKGKLNADKHELRTRTKLDLQERFPLRAGIVARFGEIMDSLYGEPADLIISLADKGGLKFEVSLPKTGSGGVHLMAIFAYDIAISENLATAGKGPNLVIHDSMVFSDVDERQRARAIEIASESASEFGYQHLISINSDNVPWGEFSSSFDFQSSVVLELHDGDPSGGILGQRIETPAELNDKD